ncbi:MAG: hypothetical protein HDR36_05905 [Treponema sp.]|nr:hypothetical protein [Treponema sp.]
MSFEAYSSEKKDDVSAKNITRSKILFRPSTKLKEQILRTSFVQQ